MQTRTRIVVLAATGLLAGWLGALGSVGRADGASASATLVNGSGFTVGTVEFIQRGTKVLVKADVSSLADGFHGFHLHANNDPSNGSGCVTPSFLSADGHYSTGGIHGAHAGDLPPLLAHDGAAWAWFRTGAVAVADLVGEAVIVHVDPDNLAHIPGRYHSHHASFNPGYDAETQLGGSFGPDNDTKAKGDAGGRAACGVIVTE